MNITLTRDLDDGTCTLGKMKLIDVELQSLERPWIPGPEGGIPGRSCVPDGTYQLVKHDSEAHPRTFALVNEALGVYHYNIPKGKDGRTVVLIHIANRPEELRGCIALGMQRLQTVTGWRVAPSKPAIDKFYNFVPWIDGHTLTITRSA